MKIYEIDKELSEMSMRGPKVDNLAKQFGEYNIETWKSNSQHIGDIEDYKLKEYQNYYTLWDNDTLVAYVMLTTAPENLVDRIWVKEEYRGQKLFSKMLWFFKTRLGRDHLMLGKLHSLSMQEVVKGMSRFKKSWYNINTKEVEPFDLSTLDKYYDNYAPTNWRLILENSGDFSD